MSASALRRYTLHALSLLMPVYTLIFGLTGPHAHPLLWLIPLVGAIGLDFLASPAREQPEAVPSWPFDLALYGLSALQLLNVGVFALRVAEIGFFSADTFAGVILVGAASGYSAIVVAHELVHRPQGHFRQLGRLLLSTVLYEHFATEHVRGHHKRVGTPEDPATARHGERLWPFVSRTVPAQFESAWELECKRLGDPEMALLDARQLNNRVLQGVVVGWSIAGLILVLGGPGSLFAHLLQAAVAVLLLEAVNYVEHWGLQRAGKRVTTVDSWDAEGWFTYYTLVGLSRHADHHAHAARPYQDLRWFEESPKMPWGYWATVVTAIFANNVVIERYEAELRRRALGPHRAVAAAK